MQYGFADSEMYPRAHPTRVVTDTEGVPVAVYLGGPRLEITMLERQWRQHGVPGYAQGCDWFAVKAADGRAIELFHDLANGIWYAQRAARRAHTGQPPAA
jgi:hypothetical protein